MAAMTFVPVPVLAKTLQLVAFGDSLMAGYKLPAGQDFPARLEAALRQHGYDVTISNASVSGDTTSGGLDRLDWSIQDGTDGVLLELGANDMLRGQDPALTRNNLDTMITRLADRHIAVYLLGMRADPTLGAEFTSRFDAIYPSLAKAHSLPIYPFFLDGVAGQSRLQLSDGMHPNPEGVALMVTRVLPGVETWLKTLQPKA
ncbi:arylesterase [Lichenifustis flavocetrariae]|uniref:Arylesterase n=1 Tax=Lichenifustis flavocetrariae TaxID=2949735 RepID=A0AA41Z011_9HYPH|nr:arylesterase [Lichenifustis flavocetrariae]MCW6507975.1 arylesterase [Lichenifustis flavocetrariae]